MTMMNWDPWRDLADMRSIYNRVFGDGAVARVASEGPAAVSSIYMPVDVSETADKYVLRAEMPGMNADDIEITVADNQVTLKGRRNESRRRSTNYVRSERRFGNFSRSFSLGCQSTAARSRPPTETECSRWSCPNHRSAQADKGKSRYAVGAFSTVERPAGGVNACACPPGNIIHGGGVIRETR